MSEKILDVRNLVVTFDTYQGSVQAVRDVSFYVNRRETVGIVGESGCGKSVTIRTVMGLNPRSSGSVKGGEVLFEGRDVLKMNDREIMDILGNRMSMIFQDPFTFLNPTMQVGRQITETYLRPFHPAPAFPAQPGAKYEALPPPAVRRDEAAHHDRHRTDLRAGRALCR